MDLELRNKVAVVTGGSSGIGLETVRLLLGEGANVALCARGGERLEQVGRDLAAAGYGGDRVLAMPCDVLEAEPVAKFQSAVLERFGRVDALINNAGVGRVSTFANTDDAAWEEELRLKFFSVIRPTRAFLPALEASEGSIVVVNSLLARQPESHMVCTSAARAGVHNLVKSLSVELAPKAIRVNEILLGLVNSGQWERRWEQRGGTGETKEEWFASLARERGIVLGRIGQPHEPAKAIVFLASRAASYITGASLEVSGGVSRCV